MILLIRMMPILCLFCLYLILVCSFSRRPTPHCMFLFLMIHGLKILRSHPLASARLPESCLSLMVRWHQIPRSLPMAYACLPTRQPSRCVLNLMPSCIYKESQVRQAQHHCFACQLTARRVDYDDNYRGHEEL
jgi:hypothetical protein